MIETIEWKSLPSMPWITGGLVSRNEDYVTLLGGDWRSEQDRRIVRDRRLNLNSQHGLGTAIRESYGDAVIPSQVEHNLDLLDQTNTLAIVTGQQVGIFGGPLYTYYKALTTILLAKSLSRETDCNVVPIFWMETADADFNEVNHVGFPPDTDQKRKVVYAPHKLIAGRSVRSHRLTAEIEEVKSNVIRWMDKLPHSRQFIQLIESAYRTDRPMANAFRELMTGLFGSDGLVLIDPMDPTISQRTAPFWEQCLSEPEQLNEPFTIGADQVISRRLPLQVRLRKDTLPIFFTNDEGFRHRIFGESDSWSIGQNGDKKSNAELQELGTAMPHRLSPGVLLRPLLQDWLLPTWVYVGGPSEIAYHAQIGPAYSYMNIPRPLIAPRISATLVEHSSRRYLDKNSWKVWNVYGGREQLLRRNGDSEKIDELFENGISHWEAWQRRIQRAADDAEIVIDTELGQAGRKIAYQWERLRHLTLRKVEQKDQVRLNHAERLLLRLMPDGILQERHDNVLYYLALYGPQLTGLITRNIDLFKPQHFVLDLEISS